jgi:TonB family protein
MAPYAQEWGAIRAALDARKRSDGTLEPWAAMTLLDRVRGFSAAGWQSVDLSDSIQRGRSPHTIAFESAMVDPRPSARRIPAPGPVPGLSEGSHEAVLRFTVLASGVVDSSSIEVISTTSPRMTQHAVATIREMLFWPGCRNGEAVAVRNVEQPVMYRMSNTIRVQRSGEEWCYAALNASYRSARYSRLGR